MDIGKAIKLCRTQKNMSQTELAELANISTSYIHLLERNKRNPNFSTVQAVAFALNVPFSILIFLASDQEDLAGIDLELAEKLSYAALEIIKN